MEEVITISKRELQEMIAEAVANKIVKVRKDFGQVAITDEDIRIVNNNHPKVLDLLQNLYSSLIHEQLKSLVLSLHGATVIKDLTDDEFQNALETYNEFKNFFLDRYNVRLTKLKQEFPEL